MEKRNRKKNPTILKKNLKEYKVVNLFLIWWQELKSHITAN